MENGVTRIAVVGSGISGLAAAWLLSRTHHVTLYERDVRLGGHSRTIDVPGEDGYAVPVDTGFIVYNEVTYPNLTHLFAHLGVETRASDMSFGVSLDNGRLEYSAGDMRGLFAQRRNLLSLRFWSMLADLVRFYREAPAHAGKLGMATLGEFLAARNYGPAFRDDHLLPMAAAIWSAPAPAILDYPAEAFIRFCQNHGLLTIGRRPAWRTVVGGSRSYVDRMMRDFRGVVRVGVGVKGIERDDHGVMLKDMRGGSDRFDHVIVATHADQALRMIDQPTLEEKRLLSAFRYSYNRAVLHDDPVLMPVRRSTWSSWNYLGMRGDVGAASLSVSYWMNRLQGIASARPLIVTLNPRTEPHRDRVIDSVDFEHPLFDGTAMTAQQALWSLQGTRRTWYCGAYFGAGFHEDGLQAGLAVAEALGARRPWQLRDPSNRIYVATPDLQVAA